jgi:hypothetical protein
VGASERRPKHTLKPRWLLSCDILTIPGFGGGFLHGVCFGLFCLFVFVLLAVEKLPPVSLKIQT